MPVQHMRMVMKLGLSQKGENTEQSCLRRGLWEYFNSGGIKQYNAEKYVIISLINDIHGEDV